MQHLCGGLQSDCPAGPHMLALFAPSHLSPTPPAPPATSGRGSGTPPQPGRQQAGGSVNPAGCGPFHRPARWAERVRPALAPPRPARLTAPPPPGAPAPAASVCWLHAHSSQPLQAEPPRPGAWFGSPEAVGRGRLPW